jgi:signal peptidase
MTEEVRGETEGEDTRETQVDRGTETTECGTAPAASSDDRRDGVGDTETAARGGLTLRRAAKVLGALVLVAVVLPFLVFAVPQVVGADHGFVILSGSMEPALSPGDVVIVSGSASVGVGDVITFDDGNSVPTTHRVVGIEDGRYLTKGDANENVDGRTVDPSDVLGRVVVTFPLIGYAILWANTTVGYVSLVVVPLVLLAATELYAWSRRDEADEEASSETAGDSGEGGQPATPERHAPADTSADEPATESAATATRPPSGTVPVAAADLKLTSAATGTLFGYAVWTIYRQVESGATPHPVSVAVLTAGLLGLLFAAWTTVAAVRAGRRAAATRTGGDTGVTPPEETARSDGGTDTEARP